MSEKKRSLADEVQRILSERDELREALGCFEVCPECDGDPLAIEGTCSGCGDRGWRQHPAVFAVEIVDFLRRTATDPSGAKESDDDE